MSYDDPPPPEHPGPAEATPPAPKRPLAVRALRAFAKDIAVALLLTFFLLVALAATAAKTGAL
jgi:hypothetical protein